MLQSGPPWPGPILGFPWRGRELLPTTAAQLCISAGMGGSTHNPRMSIQTVADDTRQL